MDISDGYFLHFFHCFIPGWTTTLRALVNYHMPRHLTSAGPAFVKNRYRIVRPHKNGLH